MNAAPARVVSGSVRCSGIAERREFVSALNERRMPMATARRNRDHESSRLAADETIAAAQPREQDVAQRAYELYEQRGGQDGRDWEDWFQAEQELRQSSAAARRHEKE